MALFRNQEEDNNYRNDSLKYCRHEEKKREERLEREGGMAALYRKRAAWSVRERAANFATKGRCEGADRPGGIH